MTFLHRTFPTLAKKSMLILTESDVRRCLPMSLAIAANRIALGSLRKEKDGGAIVPSRIGLPYFDTTTTQGSMTTTTSGATTTGTTSGNDSSSSDPCDWTLFKPAAYYSPTTTSNEDDDGDSGDGGQQPTINKSIGLRNIQKSYDNSNRFTKNNNNNTSSSAPKPPPPPTPPLSSSSSVIMGLKIVSIRANNPTRYNKPTVPASIFLVNAETGEVNAMLGGTYLTAARTAAGSAIATEICWRRRLEKRRRENGGGGDGGGLRLVVFGAGLQGDCHIEALHHLLPLSHLTIINRTLPRAKTLRQNILSTTSSSSFPISIGLLSDRDAVRTAVRSADIIVTATNASTPLFDGSWMKYGCHVNGVGSYTPQMKEVDEVMVNRCRVLIDTEEAMTVGDLMHLRRGGGEEDGNSGDDCRRDNNNVVGLLGDVLAGNIIWEDRYDDDDEGLDGTFFKSVGTAIQDVVTAYEVVKRARELGLGMEVDM